MMEYMKTRRGFLPIAAIGLLLWAEIEARESGSLHTSAGPSPVFIPPEPKTETLTLKQYGEGLGLAALCTVVPTALGYYAVKQKWSGGLAEKAMVAGLIAGPSAGQIYHGFYGHAFASGTVRLLGTTIVFISVISGLADAFGSVDCLDESSSHCDHESNDTEAGVTFGLTVYALGVTYSLVQPLLRVRITNRVGDANGSNRPNRLGFLPHTLAPVFIPERAGGMKTGLMAGWDF